MRSALININEHNTVSEEEFVAYISPVNRWQHSPKSLQEESAQVTSYNHPQDHLPSLIDCILS